MRGLTLFRMHHTSKAEANNTDFIKYILFHNFWSFLFVLSGLVDIGIGAVSYFTGALSAKNSSFPTFAICFIVGSVYLAIGLGIAMAKRKKHTP